MLKRLVLIGAWAPPPSPPPRWRLNLNPRRRSGGTYRPFEFETAKNSWKVSDIDIIKAVAKAEGFQIKLINTPWRIFATLEFRRSRHHHFRHHHHRQAQTNG